MVDTDEVHDILNNHKKWLSSGGSKGARANFSGIFGISEFNFRYANLQKADLRDLYLNGANLANANLQGADLRGSNLNYAILKNADLRNTDLRGTRFAKAIITGTDFTGALRLSYDKPINKKWVLDENNRMERPDSQA